MSIAWAPWRAVCASAVVVVTAIGPGGTTARALDAPAPAVKSSSAKPVIAKPPLAKTTVVAAPAGDKAAKSRPVNQQPSLQSSPQPPKPAAAHPAGWPTNATSDAPRESRYSHPPPAPEPEKPKAPPAQNAAEPAADAPPEAEEQYFFQRMIRARTRIMGTDPGDAKRQDRADSAEGARRPAPEPTKAGDEAPKSSGLLGSISALWGGDAPARTAAAQTATPDVAPSPQKPSSAGGETNSLLSKIGSMLPGFPGASDKK